MRQLLEVLSVGCAAAGTATDAAPRSTAKTLNFMMAILKLRMADATDAFSEAASHADTLISVADAARGACAIAGAPYGRAGFYVAEIARWDRALLRDGVGTQALREIGEGREAARFGAVAPVLQLPHELFFGCVGALPHPGELMAHGERELQRAGMLERLRQLDALVAGHRLAAQ